MTARLVDVVFDANGPMRLAQFWAEALGWAIGETTDDEVALVPTDDTGFGILFGLVPEKKSSQNRTHFDLTTASLEDQNDTVARLLEIGALMSTSVRAEARIMLYWRTRRATSFVSSRRAAGSLLAALDWAR